MKIAQMPDGSLMKFDPETPDDEMDRQVRAKLGLPEPIDPVQQTQDVLVQVGTMVQQLMQQNAEIVQHVAECCRMMAECQNAQSAYGQQLGDAVAALSQQMLAAHNETAGKMDELKRAYLAPREIITDKSGKPIGAKVVGNI